MLRRKRVVLDHIEGGADRGISGALKDGPQSEVVAVPRSERDAVKLGRGVKVGGHRLGEGPRSAVLWWLGLGLAVIGLALVLAAQQAMGDSWRIGVDPSERTGLVTTGAFATVRNRSSPPWFWPWRAY